MSVLMIIYVLIKQATLWTVRLARKLKAQSFFLSQEVDGYRVFG